MPLESKYSFLDEDDFASDSNKAYASQQSIKAYVDALSSVSGDFAITGDLTLNGNDIKDSGGNVVISFDGLGNIDIIGPVTYASTTVEDMIVNSGTITFNNQGAGADPILDANNAAQILDLTGALVASGDITAANIVTAGNVDGVDISAWLDQSVKIAASPTFIGLTLSGAIATPTTIATSGNITCGGDLLMAAAKSVDCKTNGAYLKPRYVSQALIPTPDTDELLVWIDTDTNTVSLVYNDPTSGVVSVAMA